MGRIAEVTVMAFESALASGGTEATHAPFGSIRLSRDDDPASFPKQAGE
jgi:hypothetical protein